MGKWRCNSTLMVLGTGMTLMIFTILSVNPTRVGGTQGRSGLYDEERTLLLLM
jgi:hypothetical protein